MAHRASITSSDLSAAEQEPLHTDLQGPAAAAAAASATTDKDLPTEKASASDFGSSGTSGGSRYARLVERFPILKKKRGIALVCAVPLVLLSGLAGLAALSGNSTGGGGGSVDAAVILDDAEFYGQSPAVYPSPEISGTGSWAKAFEKAHTLVSNMTLEEKISLTSGGDADNGCSGNIPAVERLDFPGFCLGDAGNGLRATDFVSSFPSGIHVGASWNRHLTHRRGAAMAAEFKKKGVNVLLGPVVGPIGRVVSGGRNWEALSPDPYLSGALVYESVDGIQAEGVIASTKHFIGNEQETHRTPRDDVAAVSSNIDDKTMHELYLWPFQDAVRAGTGSIMCSYQRVNNSYGCANSKILNGLLKTELGFQGFVVSDWFAQHAGVATALAGMDMAMPRGGDFWGEELVTSVRNGSVPESRIDDMAVRTIAAWYHMEQDKDFPTPGIGMPRHIGGAQREAIDARDPDARETLLAGAVEGHVLVKNTKKTLPLKSPRQLSVFGYSARSPDVFSPVAGDVESYTWSFGAQAVTAEEVHAGFAGHPSDALSAIGFGGTLIHGGGSGATTPASFLSPFEALKMRALANGTAIFHDFTSPKPLVSAASDACLVFGNAWASESYDRPGLYDDFTDGLIQSVADQCSKTIVVLHNAGPRIVDRFIEHVNVTAVIFAHLPGQETGPALVSLLYGDENFSGKLPYTVACNETDYGRLAKPDLPSGEFEKFPQSDFDEGVFIDYRRFDEEAIKPRYEFGFGMSYTTFSMSDLGVDKANETWDEWPSGEVTLGGQEDLWDVLVTVNASVKNTGSVAGAEVAQFYLGIPDAPSKQLRGFEKVFLEPGEETSVSFNVTRRDLSTWDVAKQSWHLQRGRYNVFVGSSSRNLPHEDEFTI